MGSSMRETAPAVCSSPTPAEGAFYKCRELPSELTLCLKLEAHPQATLFSVCLVCLAAGMIAMLFVLLINFTINYKSYFYLF